MNIRALNGFFAVIMAFGLVMGCESSSSDPSISDSGDEDPILTPDDAKSDLFIPKGSENLGRLRIRMPDGVSDDMFADPEGITSGFKVTPEVGNYRVVPGQYEVCVHQWIHDPNISKDSTSPSVETCESYKIAAGDVVDVNLTGLKVGWDPEVLDVNYGDEAYFYMGSSENGPSLNVQTTYAKQREVFQDQWILMVPGDNDRFYVHFLDTNIDAIYFDAPAHGDVVEHVLDVPDNRMELRIELSDETYFSTPSEENDGRLWPIMLAKYDRWLEDGKVVEEGLDSSWDTWHSIGRPFYHAGNSNPIVDNAVALRFFAPRTQAENDTQVERWELWVNDTVLPIERGQSMDVLLGRLDIDDPWVTTESGDEYQSKGTAQIFTYDWDTDLNGKDPIKFHVSKGIGGGTWETQLATPVGLDVVPGSYYVAVDIETEDGGDFYDGVADLGEIDSK